MNTLERLQNIEEAKKYGWNLADTSKFLRILTSFEERLSQLLDGPQRPRPSDILIENVCFTPDNPVIIGAGLGLSFSGKELFIDPKKLKPWSFFERPNLLIGHEYGHLLIFHPDLLWLSLPKAFKENLKKENLGKDYLVETTRDELGNLVFYSLAEGLDNPYFQGLKVNNLVKAGEGHELIFRNIKDAYFDIIAERIAHLILPGESKGEMGFEKKYLREELSFYTAELNKEKSHIFYPLLAHSIAYAKSTHNHDLLQGLSLEGTKLWPREFQDAFPAMIDNLFSLWTAISIKGKKGE